MAARDAEKRIVQKLPHYGACADIIDGK